MVLQVTNKIIAVVSRELVDIVTKPIPPPNTCTPTHQFTKGCQEERGSENTSGELEYLNLVA